MKFFRIVRKNIWVILLVLIPLLFFYQTFLFQKVPFPGDLLVGEYAPYSSYPFQGYVAGSFPNKAQNFDVIELLYPAKYFSIDSFKNLEFPLWNPYIFSGTPHLASFQSGSFYPLNVIFFILPFFFSWTLYVILQPILAGIFTFLFLREMKVGSKGSFFGVITFAFSSYLTVWIEYGNIGHSILWLPLLLFLSMRFVKTQSFGWAVAMITGLSISLLAGYIQTTFYVFIFTLVFILFNISSHKKETLPLFIKTSFIFITPLLISSVQLLPFLELLNNSTRSPYSTDAISRLLIPKVHLATLFAPDFFGNPATRNYWLDGTYIERVSYFGVAPLILGIFAIFKGTNRNILFFTFSSILIFLLSFDNAFAKTIYSLNIPLISTAVPTRLMFLFVFSASILAAFGYDYLEKTQKTDRKLLVSIFAIGLIFSLLWACVLLLQKINPGHPWLEHLNISRRNLLLPSALFSFAAFLFVLHKFSAFKKYILIGLIALTIFDLYYFFQKITPFSPKESIYPKTEVFNQLRKIQGFDRSWGYGSAYIEPNIQSFEKIYSTDGYDALHIRDYSELVTSSKHGEYSSLVPRSEAEVVRGFGINDLRDNDARQRILNLTGVKYILHKTQENSPPDYKTFDSSIYSLLWQKGNWQIYENKQALPRVILFGNSIVEKEKKEVLRRIHDKSFNLEETVILEEDLPQSFIPAFDTEAKGEIKEYKSNEVTINTSSSTDTILFISDSFYPGWEASVDGVSGKIYRADYAFRAVPVRKGDHEVVFSYKPSSFDLGLKITGLTLLILTLLSISKAIKIRFTK